MALTAKAFCAGSLGLLQNDARKDRFVVLKKFV
jgi:hypothetical protein